MHILEGTTDQEFLTFEMLSSLKESDDEECDATAQPLHKD